MNLQRLIYLCHLKNELNRKRRRFYYIWSYLAGHSYRADQNEVRKHKSFSKTSAWKGYKQAQSDMKAMTHEMRVMRKEVGARFIWNDGGLIEAIEFDGRRVSQKHFKKFHDSEVFELEFFKS